MNPPNESFPLQWPIGWPRCPRPTRAKFGTVRKVHSAHNQESSWTQKTSASVSNGRDRLLGELRRLGATDIVISSNLRVRLDGLPTARAGEPGDSGAAVYFRLKNEPRVLACDKWDRVADNLVALAKHIEAVRGQVRWGVGSLEQAFGGYKALTAVGEKKPWWVVLALPETASRDQIDRKRIELLRRHHPDVAGGSHTMAAEINAAYAEATAS